ncbi:trophoblast-specific protein alpha-like [Mastomys coucha]|uniref:trophoblast-specific protein alpha-like n=1 Tax=Mastomys coucha TaxID=35658 RepID=UPI001261E44C|nr:trophoblast-specific protein alpha-like [Mastomys coucha]
MAPTVFLVILCLGVASAAIDPDASLDAELQEQKNIEELKKALWKEFMKTIKLDNSKDDQETDGFNIEMSASGELTDEEFTETMTNILHPMFGEEKNQEQPVDDVPEFEDWAESGEEIPVQDQV